LIYLYGFYAVNLALCLYNYKGNYKGWEDYCTILEQLAFYKKSHKNQTHYQLWQEGCHPEIISTVGMMRQKIQYIHDNPVKRGYVDFSEHWLLPNNNLNSIKNHLKPCIKIIPITRITPML
jgi:hypothetical protein